MNTKAIEIAKRMIGSWVHSDVIALRDAVLAEEQADYDYHTTPGEVIQPDWESYDEIENEWNRTSYPGDITIPGSPLYRSKKKRKWVPKVGEWVTVTHICSSDNQVGDVARVDKVSESTHTWRLGREVTWHDSDSSRPATPEEIALAERREKLPPIPDGWQLLQVKAGESLPQYGELYSYDAALGWVPSLSAYSKEGRIYAHNPAVETPLEVFREFIPHDRPHVKPITHWQLTVNPPRDSQ